MSGNEPKSIADGNLHRLHRLQEQIRSSVKAGGRIQPRYTYNVAVPSGCRAIKPHTNLDDIRVRSLGGIIPGSGETVRFENSRPPANKVDSPEFSKFRTLARESAASQEPIIQHMPSASIVFEASVCIISIPRPHMGKLAIMTHGPDMIMLKIVVGNNTDWHDFRYIFITHHCEEEVQIKIEYVPHSTRAREIRLGMRFQDCSYSANFMDTVKKLHSSSIRINAEVPLQDGADNSDSLIDLSDPGEDQGSAPTAAVATDILDDLTGLDAAFAYKPAENTTSSMSGQA